MAYSTSYNNRLTEYLHYTTASSSEVFVRGLGSASMPTLALCRGRDSYFKTSACNLWHLTPAYILKLYNGNVDVHTLCKARMLLELLSVRSRASRFTSETIHNDLDTFIDFIAMVN